MRPITEINTLPRKRGMGWHKRLDEVEAADDTSARELACHHFSRCLDQNLHDIRHAFTRHSRFAQMPEWELKIVRDQACDAEASVFVSCLIMDRLESGIAAVKKIARDTLHLELIKMHDQLWRILKKLEDVRQRHFSRAISAAERRRIDLATEMGPLVDDLEKCIREFYTSAQRRYNLPGLNGGAK